MIRTQIQLPARLHEDLRALVVACPWGDAENIRALQDERPAALAGPIALWIPRERLAE